MKRAETQEFPLDLSAAGTSSSRVTRSKKPRNESTSTASPGNIKGVDGFMQDPRTCGKSRLNRVNNSAAYECPVCLDSIQENEMVTLPCFHAFHQECMNMLLLEHRCLICFEETSPTCNDCQETVPPQNAGQDTAPFQNSSQEIRTPVNEQRENSSNRPECPICLESMKNDEMKSLACSHAFHEACIDEWLIANPSCPICRQETAPPQNTQPSLNNQGYMIFEELHALPGSLRNNVLLSSDNTSMRVNNGGTDISIINPHMGVNDAIMLQHAASMGQLMAHMRMNDASMRRPAANTRMTDANMRQHAANMRQHAANVRQHAAYARQHAANVRQHAANVRQHAANARQHAANVRTNHASIRQNASNMRIDANMRQPGANVRINDASMRQHASNTRQHAANMRRNSARMNNVGSIRLINGSPTIPNNGGIEIRHNGSSVTLNDGDIEMAPNGSSIILNNGVMETIMNNRGTEIRLNDGSCIILNNGSIEIGSNERSLQS